MADNDKTRAETVEDNFDEAVALYGPDNIKKIALVWMKDVTVSLGMIADNTTPASN